MSENIPYFITAAFYFLMVAVFSFFSVFSIYVLVRYGRSKTAALSLSLIYGVIFISLIISSFITLQKLNIL